jgi:Cys-tRNA(Pro)/Cys-tRNA(Cys) deacylase
LEEAGIPYRLHFYMSEGLLDGPRVAELIDVSPNRVFKTLVTQGRTMLNYVFVLPVNQELDLKLAAALTGEKYIEMLPANRLLATTGYVRGGCSPIGMKKKFTTFFDAAAAERKTICVSAGRLGMQMELEAEALRTLTDGRYEFITTEAARLLATR